MKNKSNLIVAIVTTIVTIGILAATLGKPCYLKHHKKCTHENQCKIK